MIEIIVAHDEFGGIGKNNLIPWYIPGEMKWLSEVTKAVKNREKKNAIVMGKKTWISLPEERRPLVDRLNVVISSGLVVNEKGLVLFTRVDDAINTLKSDLNIEKIFIFGGESLYRYTLDNKLVDSILVTEVPGNYFCDRFFPKIPEEFIESERSHEKYGDVLVTRKTYIKNKSII